MNCNQVCMCVCVCVCVCVYCVCVCMYADECESEFRWVIIIICITTVSCNYIAYKSKCINSGGMCVCDVGASCIMIILPPLFECSWHCNPYFNSLCNFL